MEEDQTYFENIVSEVSLEEIKSVFGEDWDKIKDKLQGNEKFVHFSSSPFFWENLVGREYYYIMLDGKIMYKKLIGLS